jgi:type II secretory pathway predicted ATPase ExeA
MDSRDRAAILLAGLPKLNSTLTLQIHEPLRQRIVMNYNLEGLTKDEGKTYILEKLKGAGCNQTIFEDAAIEAILNAADGTPKLINKYCNASMKDMCKAKDLAGRICHEEESGSQELSLVVNNIRKELENLQAEKRNHVKEIER